MNTTPKTDECIKMLGEAKLVFASVYYNGKGYFNKDRIIDFQNRIMAMLDYRLMPFCVISMPDNADKDTAKANPILQNISNFDAFWYAMKNYQLVTGDDLRNEFWSVCPDLESIPKFLGVMNVKFDEVKHRYNTDIDTIKKQYNGLNERVKAGIISKQEADEMFWNIHFIADRYNFIMNYIGEIYRTFRKMVEPQQTGTNNNTVKPKPHFTRVFSETEQKKLHEGLTNGGFLPKGTIYSHFCHVFGGTAIPDSEMPFESLQWAGSIKELHYFITKHFPKQKNQWQTAVNCFLMDNKPINKNSLATAIDKYDNPPETSPVIDSLLN
jgi:hypothetical protein